MDKPKTNVTRNKLLTRGPKIVPQEEFKLDDEAISNENEIIQPKTKPKTRTAKSVANQITSIRVSKSTRNKLNALIQLDKADMADTLIEMMIEEYIEANLMKEEKRNFNLIVDILQKRDK